MSDETYGPERAERLVALLRALAGRIQELDRAGGGGGVPPGASGGGRLSGVHAGQRGGAGRGGRVRRLPVPALRRIRGAAAADHPRTTYRDRKGTVAAARLPSRGFVSVVARFGPGGAVRRRAREVLAHGGHALPHAERVGSELAQPLRLLP